MVLDYPVYMELVKRFYKKKRANNQLSPLLVHSTRTSIRRECVNVYRERFEERDEPALRAFFGPATGRRFLDLIQDFDAEEFRTLNNFLKGITDSTEQENLELLAWLIDFPYRPLSIDNNVELSKEELAFVDKLLSGSITEEHSLEPEKIELRKNEEKPGNILGEGTEKIKEIKKTEELIPPNIVEKTKTKRGYRRAVAIFSSFVICTGGIYALWVGDKDSRCMCWASDHFEKLSCNEDQAGRTKPF